MLFLTLLTLFISAVIGESTLGSISVEPLDYAKYSDSIDYALIRYFENGTVFFYDKTNTNTINSTQTIKDATILDSGLFEVDADDNTYLIIDSESGLLTVTDDNSTIDGLFYIDGSELFYSYENEFIACKSNEFVYTLFWTGSSSSVLRCNVQASVYLKVYNSKSNGESVDQFFPDTYDASEAEKASDSSASSSASASDSSSSAQSSSANAGFINSSGTSTLFGSLMMVCLMIFA